MIKNSIFLFSSPQKSNSTIGEFSKFFSLTLTLLALVFINPIEAFSQVYFKIGGSGAGTSWDDARSATPANIQSAINAGGTLYFAASPTNYGSNYKLNNNVTIIGGFPASATGTDLSGYNPNTNQTFFGGGAGVILPAFSTSTTGTSYTVTLKGINVGKYVEAANASSSLIGVFFETNLPTPRGNFTFENIIADAVTSGTAHRNSVFFIAGNTNDPSAKSYTFKNCLFKNNWSGGMPAIELSDLRGGTALIDGCSFSNNGSIKNTNISSTSGGSGAVSIFHGPHDATYGSTGFTGRRMVISNSTFCGNTGVDMGALVVQSNGGTIIENCIFSGNGATLFNSSGGAIMADISNLRISKTDFFNNSAHLGGGALLLTDCNLNPLLNEITDCNFIGNYTFTTNTSGSNGGRSGGGAIHAGQISQGLKITNTNFKQNYVTLSNWGGTGFGNGGAINNWSTVIQLSGVSFYQNKTGGASGSSTVYGSDIYNKVNTATPKFSPMTNVRMQLANAAAYYVDGNTSANYGFPGTNVTFDGNSVNPTTATAPGSCPTTLFIDVDTDKDGIYDSVDLDDDNDGIPDVAEGGDTQDSDGDGKPNRIDLDSDNDGISDLIESGNAAAIAADTDKNGTITNSESPVGANGIPLAAEGTEGGTVPTAKDTDGDGVKDFLDLDSDNDEVYDVIEAFTTGTPPPTLNGRISGADADGDGIRDAVDSNTTVGSPIGGASSSIADTDGDGILNFRDLDSDNDGINDVVEAGGTDPDGNGLPGTGAVTVNGAGITGFPNMKTPKDQDNDGIKDMLDLDSDNDGINDVTESGLPTSADANGDGRVDGSDDDGDGILAAADGTPSAWGDAITAGSPATPLDSDGDGVPDYRDLDSDNDGINDITESGLPASADANGDGKIDYTGNDPDSDGLLGAADGNPATWGDTPNATSPSGAKDSDGDGVPDYKDLDSDNDGINDIRESGLPASADADGNGKLDDAETADGDGIVGIADGAPSTWGDTPNATSPNGAKDTDGDTVPDFKDLDSDNDGKSDLAESGNATALTADTDNDGVIDFVAGPSGNDPDGDGILTVVDGAPNTWSDSGDTVPTDTDGDGSPDYVDITSDGTNQDIDSTPYAGLDTNNNGVLDGGEIGGDPDGDGIANSIDTKDDEFGGLPNSIPTPDLRPIFIMNNAGFIKPSALSRPAELRLYNIGMPNSTTNGAITVYVYPPSAAFTIALNNSPDWTISFDAPGNYYTLVSNVSIAQGTSGFKAINLTIMAANNAPKGKFNMTVEIGDGSGGEVNNANNTVSQELAVSGN